MGKLEKKRCVIPGKIIDLLLIDDDILNESAKIKKYFSANFPRSDQFTSDNGFHIHFALAGYSPESVKIRALNPYIYVSSMKNKENAQENRDSASEELEEEPRYSFSKGMFSRGIAQRDFDIKYLISEEFDVESLEAEMVHGLLKIRIPYKKQCEPKVFNIKNSN